MNPLGIILSVAGAFSCLGAIFNWDWFMNHRKSRLFVKVFGRTGARIFYGLLGVGLVILGALITLGVVN